MANVAYALCSATILKVESVHFCQLEQPPQLPRNHHRRIPCCRNSACTCTPFTQSVSTQNRNFHHNHHQHTACQSNSARRRIGYSHKRHYHRSFHNCRRSYRRHTLYIAVGLTHWLSMQSGWHRSLSTIAAATIAAALYPVTVGLADALVIDAASWHRTPQSAPPIVTALLVHAGRRRQDQRCQSMSSTPSSSSSSSKQSARPVPSVLGKSSSIWPSQLSTLSQISAGASSPSQSGSPVSEH